MIPGLTIDLRGHDFETQAELREIVRELLPAIREGYPMVAIHSLVISDWQMKLLRLERFIKRGLTNAQARQQVLTRLDGWQVTVVPDGEPIRCANCGGNHDQNQAWYG